MTLVVARTEAREQPTDALRASYDAVPYPNLTYAQTHPDALATVAMLAGMSPAPVDRCRVLELGCASGANLLPMADALPRSQFVGVDLSDRQVAQGLEVVGTLGLENVRLIATDVLALGPGLGSFDYIIAHGLFSWVPREVQDKVFQICRDHLAPHGVAFISYNANPGWRMLGVIRDMLLFRTRGETDPARRVALAREMLAFMHGALEASSEANGVLIAAYYRFLQRELEQRRDVSDAYLLHDELETINEPLYFHEFVDRARVYDLQYLSDVDLRSGSPSQLPEGVADGINRMAHDTHEREQYMDFLTNRMFRRSLLCHAGLQLQRTITSDHLSRFYLTTTAERQSQVADHTGKARFVAGDGEIFSTNDPSTIAAFEELRAVAPRAIGMSELLDRVRARQTVTSLPPHSFEEDGVRVGSHLLMAFAQSDALVSLHAYSPAIVPGVSQTPEALRFARMQARSEQVVTNAFHVRVELTPLARALLPLLDGTRTSGDLVDALAANAGTDHTSTNTEGSDVPNSNKHREQLSSEIVTCLQWLAESALLIG